VGTVLGLVGTVLGLVGTVLGLVGTVLVLLSRCGIASRVKPLKTEKLAHIDSLVSVHHLRPRAGLVGPVYI